MPDSPFHTLAANADWPDLDGVTPWDYALGGHGRALVDQVILDHKKDAPLLLEVGCFLCASAKRWLQVRDDVLVVGVDPWGDDLVDQCARYVGRPALTRAYPNRAQQEQFAADIARQGPYATALANVREHRARFAPVRGIAPHCFAPLAERGICPDIIYLDADKNYATLEAAYLTWPNARLTGDDWHWGRTKGYPMRQVVTAFAEKYGFTIEADHATWVLR